MDNMIVQILELYFLGGSVKEITDAGKDAYNKYKRDNYSEYLYNLMFGHW